VPWYSWWRYERDGVSVLQEQLYFAVSLANAGAGTGAIRTGAGPVPSATVWVRTMQLAGWLAG